MRAFNPKICAVVLLTVVHIALGCPSLDRISSRASTFARRWLSVGYWPDSAGGQTLESVPWPDDPLTPGKKALRYCYDSEKDYNGLHLIVQAAIKIWEPALKDTNSALVIRPDLGIEKTLCGDPGVAKDALIIQDTTGSGQTETDPGYNPRIMEGFKKAQAEGKLEEWQAERSRTGAPFHILRLSRSDSKLENGVVVSVGDKDRVAMAHEIGHSIGFDHEDQRPDRDEYVKFDCTALADYDMVKKHIADHTVTKRIRWQQGDTIEKACTDLPTAERYRFSATQHIKVAQNILGELSYSKEFDFNSIMMYGSYDGSKAVMATNFPKGAVIAGYEGSGKKKTLTRKLYKGGREPKFVTSVSEGDAARVAQLYPIVKDGQAALPAIALKDNWKEVAGDIPMKPQKKGWKDRIPILGGSSKSG